jgi:tetratricopeptide (TPR) repeat protein
MQVTYWLGRASEVLGDRKGAEQADMTAIGLSTPVDRDAIDPYVALSKLLAGQGRETEAQAKLDAARAKLPDSAPMQRALGEVAAARGLFDEAVQHYQSAIAKDPKDLGARFLLGVTYRRMQKLDDASTQLDLVAATDKDYPNLAMERGLVFEQSGHVDKALVEFQSALAKAPSDLDLQLRVGAALVGIGKADEAAKMLKAVFDKRQNSAEVNHYLGRAYFSLGGSNLVDAARYLKRAVELDPNRAEYHLYLAWVATESTPIDLGTAREEVKKALALDQLLGDAYWQRAVTEEIGGAVDDAIADLKKALQLRPSRTEAHATLAKCYSDKNQPDKAMAEWAIALAQDSDRADWQYGYGKLLFDRGKLAAALPHLLVAATEGEKTTPAPGWFSQSEFMLAEALRKGGKRAEAKEHYTRFLQSAPPSSPDRSDALAALKALGAPYEPEK